MVEVEQGAQQRLGSDPVTRVGERELSPQRSLAGRAAEVERDDAGSVGEGEAALVGAVGDPLDPGDRPPGEVVEQRGDVERWRVGQPEGNSGGGHGGDPD